MAIQFSRRCRKCADYSDLLQLGIRHVGQTVAQMLARAFSNLDDLAAADEANLVGVTGIGPVVVRRVTTFFQNPDVRLVLDKIRAAGVRTHAPARSMAPQPLAGKTFVLTGGFVAYTREQLDTSLQDLGAKVATSVSNKTGYVIVGANPGSKFARAKELSNVITSHLKKVTPRATLWGRLRLSR